jgi:prepilin-type N-terminal cleavage/methylation domain-containing protein
MTRRQDRNRRGFTLVELMVIIVIIGIIGTMAFVFLQDRPDIARWNAARSEMMEIHKALEIYKLDNESEFPESLDEIANRFPRGVPRCPFTKQPFQYERTQDGYRLVCLGKDQAEGGESPPDKDIVVTHMGLTDE